MNDEEFGKTDLPGMMRPRGGIGITGSLESPEESRKRLLERVQRLEAQYRYALWLAIIAFLCISGLGVTFIGHVFQHTPVKVACHELRPGEHRVEFVEADFRVLRECAR